MFVRDPDRWRVTRPLLSTLPRDVYLSDDVWDVERERIWFAQWVLVGRVHGVASPGDRLLVDVAGESIVVRDEHVALRAFYNVCRHRGAELLAPGEPTCGSFGSAIRCPYHAWTYGLDGALRRAPFLGRGDTPDIALHQVPVDEWGGFVFVNLSGDDAVPLLEQTACRTSGSMAQRSVGAGRRSHAAPSWPTT